MRPRQTEPNDSGRIPKKIEFEPHVYRKAEALIRRDKRRPKPTLKTVLSEAIEAEHARLFGKEQAA